MPAVFYELQKTAQEAKFAYEQFAAVEEAATKVAINALEALLNTTQAIQDGVLKSIPKVSGAGMTVNIDPQAIAAGASWPAYSAGAGTLRIQLLAAKDSLVVTDAVQVGFDVAEELIDLLIDQMATYDGYYDSLYGVIVNGKERVVKLDQVRRQVYVNEQAHLQNPLPQFPLP